MVNTIYSTCLHPITLKTKLIVQCGQCPLCRRRRLFEWSIRAKHELQTNKHKAIFITLTYKPKHLPKEGVDGREIIKKNEADAQGNLNPNDMTLFLKRLRKYIEKKYNKKIKYIYCGEYGEKRHRPHYHALIYNLEPYEIKKETLIKLWKKGNVDKDNYNATEKSILYILGYVSKKILNRNTRKTEYIEKGRLPPFLRTSKGIGKTWAEQNINEWTKNGIIQNGKIEAPIPRYYIKRAKITEGKTIRYKVTKVTTQVTEVTDKTTEIPGVQIKKETQWRYKHFTNPNGKYTSIINETLNKLAEQKLTKMENEIQDKFYFEKLIYIQQQEETRTKYLAQSTLDWKISQTLTEEQIAKALEYKTFIQKEKENKPKKEIREIFIDKNLYKEETQLAKYKTELIFKGIYGKRMRMETMQELNGENI